MKKVVVIVSEDTTKEEMLIIKDAFNDPNKHTIVVSELCVKQVIAVDFNDVSVAKTEV